MLCLYILTELSEMDSQKEDVRKLEEELSRIEAAVDKEKDMERGGSAALGQNSLLYSHTHTHTHTHTDTDVCCRDIL